MLSEMMGIEGFGIAEVKSKIRSIRNAYTLEVAKIKKSHHSGAGVDELYKPKVAWFPVADRILHQVIQIRETQSSRIETETETQSESVNVLEDTQSSTVAEVLCCPPSDSSPATQATPRKLTPTTTAPRRALRKNRKSSTDKALEELKAIAQKLEEKPNREEENEFDCFGKSVSCQLKKLPESLALQSMAYIQSYLVQQRLSSNVNRTFHSAAASSASSITYENAASSTPSNSNYDNDDINSYPEQEHTDILSQAINTSFYGNRL